MWEITTETGHIREWMPQNVPVGFSRSWPCPPNGSSYNEAIVLTWDLAITKLVLLAPPAVPVGRGVRASSKWQGRHLSATEHQVDMLRVPD